VVASQIFSSQARTVPLLTLVTYVGTVRRYIYEFSLRVGSHILSASADRHQITIEAQSYLTFHRLARNRICTYLSPSL
jgi:hypothetical protein